MGIIRFNETRWNRGHGMFGAHEKRGLLRANASLSKDYLLLHGNFKSTKPSTQD
jgi:hypothetical protein